MDGLFRQYGARLQALLAEADPGLPADGEPPKDSIEGAIRGLFHAVVDGIAGAVPRNLQTSSKVERAASPVVMMYGGRNSQGLPSRLIVRIDLDPNLQGVHVGVQLVLFNPQGKPVANPAQTFQAGRADSIRQLAKAVGEWIGQSEALQMAPVGVAPAGVMPPAQQVQAPQVPASFNARNQAAMR